MLVNALLCCGHDYHVLLLIMLKQLIQESHAVARKLRDAAAVLFGLKFADNVHYKFKIKSSQASKAMLQRAPSIAAGFFSVQLCTDCAVVKNFVQL